MSQSGIAKITSKVLPPQVPTSFVTNSGTAIPAANVLNVFGSTVAAGSNPFRSIGSGNTVTYQTQISQAIAATDATKIGLSAFNSSQFTVDANGFVSATGSIPIQFTADSGTAVPSAGNINILGRSGSKTSASGSTITVKSPPYQDQGGSTTVTLNSGSFVTAAITLTLPASAGLSDGDILEFICITAGALIIQSVGSQKIRIGSLISSGAGTATSSNIGDSLTLRFRAADGFFYATSVVGVWVLT